jgi:trk system potassium uptake protein TrkH
MFVGASPGGTGGGLKTTTFAVFLAVFRAELRGGEPRFLDRRLANTTIARAVSVAFVSTVALTVIVLLLLISEHGRIPLAIVFEAVSAFATVGLSTGLTPELSVAGKLLIIATMLLGRIGPLTFALAAARRPVREPARFPEERLMIG